MLAPHYAQNIVENGTKNGNEKKSMHVEFLNGSKHFVYELKFMKHHILDVK